MSLPKHMQAAQVLQWKQPYQIQDNVPVPQPKDWDLLLQIKAAGLCHTDSMVQEGQSPMGAELPITGSHEPAGVVVGLGDKAQEAGQFKKGDRVAALCMLNLCGECPDCKQYSPVYCRNIQGAAGVTTHGAFADYCIVDSRSSAHIPQHMSFAQAAPLCCAGTTIYTAIRRAGLKPGQTLGIVGLGALGILGVQMSQALGYKTVGVDSRPEPVELAQSLARSNSNGEASSDYLVLQTSTPQAEALEKIKAMDPEKDWVGLDAVVVATDAQDSFSYATSLLRSHGTFVLVGQPEKGVTFQYHDLIFKDITIIGSLLGSGADLQACIELCTEHGIKSHITEFPLKDVNKAVEATHDPKRKGKNVITFT